MLLDIFDPKAPPRAIGIDLGTTHSIVAVVRDGQPHALVTCDGTGLLPSVVHYGKHGNVMVGASARGYLASDPRRTVSSAKRFMGRSYSDKIGTELSHLSLSIPETEKDARSVRFDLGERSVSPVEVSAEILRSLKQSAVDQLTHVGGAVITVPAYFDDAQRQATRDAGRLAGLEVLRLLNEPTAAALAYGLDQQKNGVFAVYDLGGGTFDVTVLLLDDGVFQVKSTGGDTVLGGDDFDRVIAEAMLREMGFSASEISGGHIAQEVVAVVLSAARELKHRLTDQEEARTTLLRRGGGEISYVLTRADFARSVQALLSRTGKASLRALRDADVRKEDLDGVLLVGGSTRMPAVRAYVESIFGRPPLTDLDPDLVVAYGAAISAAALTGDGDSVLLLDVLPLSLGVETMGGGVDKLLPRNTTIPVGARSTFTTYADNQTGFEIHVVQGERELAQDCRSLARFSLKGIPPMPAGMARLELQFDVDENNLLAVSAKELTTGLTQRVEVKASYGLSDEDIEDMLIDALEHGEEDLQARRLADAHVEGERLLLATEKSLAVDRHLLSEIEHRRVVEALEDLKASLGHGPEGSAGAATSPSRVQVHIRALDDATEAWAGRRMDHAIFEALSGKDLTTVEAGVKDARGVDAHVKDHEENRTRR